MIYRPNFHLPSLNETGVLPNCETFFDQGQCGLTGFKKTQSYTTGIIPVIDDYSPENVQEIQFLLKMKCR